MPLYLGNQLISGLGRPIDTIPIPGSDHLVTSGGVAAALSQIPQPSDEGTGGSNAPVGYGAGNKSLIQLDSLAEGDYSVALGKYSKVIPCSMRGNLAQDITVSWGRGEDNYIQVDFNGESSLLSDDYNEISFILAVKYYVTKNSVTTTHYDIFETTSFPYSVSIISEEGSYITLPTKEDTDIFDKENFLYFVGAKVDSSTQTGLALGLGCLATGRGTVAVGYMTSANGTQSFAAGYNSHAFDSSVAMGLMTKTGASAAVAMGAFTQAIGEGSFAAGISNIVTGRAGTAFGDSNTASGDASLAIGTKNTAKNFNAVALGLQTTASGQHSMAIGELTLASGKHSFAQGHQTQAIGARSSAFGNFTIAKANFQTAIGQYNIADENSKYAFIIGNGSAEGRSNALTIDWDGKVTSATATSDNDNDLVLVTKGYLKELINNLRNELNLSTI